MIVIMLTAEGVLNEYNNSSYNVGKGILLLVIIIALQFYDRGHYNCISSGKTNMRNPRYEERRDVVSC